MLVLDWSLFLFFKQKTAYEMRISDWSSDVCSSDLHDATHTVAFQRVHGAGDRKIGLAGAGRADAEIQIVRRDVFQVLLLLRAATADHAALAANDDFVAGALVLFRAVVIVVAKLLDAREVDVQIGKAPA